MIIGAHTAGAERPQLRYAVSDAERFARVLVELGGVSRTNEILLKQPRVQDVVIALDQLQARVIAARRTAGADGGRTEVLVYYSGHADEQGLLLGDDRYSYRSLRTRLDQIPADVRIAVLDACASGAFTRIKSGKTRPAFLVDQSADMRGHAFLTSSAATEAAQESDRIRACYFTHYLVSGFRGAADLSGDGKVTLNEAYQFAFKETLGRTVDTRAGPQHPSYDINLSGTGDVVMTDVRQTSSILVIPESLEGRFFVRNSARELCRGQQSALTARSAADTSPRFRCSRCAGIRSLHSAVETSEVLGDSPHSFRLRAHATLTPPVLLVMAKPNRLHVERVEDRRTDTDRRSITRSGRRERDPMPVCPSCGLAVDRPHGSDADCIAALQDEVAARRARNAR